MKTYSPVIKGHFMNLDLKPMCGIELDLENVLATQDARYSVVCHKCIKKRERMIQRGYG